MRDKKIARSKMTFIRPKSFKFNGDKKKNFVEIYKQSTYKYLLYIEGHCAACRYGFMMRLGSVILKVEKSCVADQMWYFPLLRPYYDHVPVKADLSDLKEKIEWCKSHDAECKQIAENGRKFYDKYFTKDFVFDYLSDIFNKTASMIGPNYNVDELEIVRREKDKNYKAFEFISYNQIVKPEMTKYKERYSLKFETIRATTNRNQITGTCIVVPFRENKYQNRAEQLEQFIRHYSVMNIPILIVTQSDDGYGFNRGALLNVGYHFLQTQAKKKIETVIFHDVDLLFPAEFVQKYYGLDSKEIIHFGKNVQDYYDYPDFLGGAIQFSKDAFQKINGFPNHIYGWGGEDDALKVRIASLKIPVQRPDEPKFKAEIPLGPGQKETKDIPEMIAKHKNEDLLSDELIWKMNGLNSLHYKVVNQVTKSPGVFQITVDIH